MRCCVRCMTKLDVIRLSMTTLKRQLGKYLQYKYCENRFMWFGHVDYVVKRVDEIENSHITRDIRRLRKIIR